MKIGIITFHCADNYGAVLQTCGLYQKLTELFKNSEIYVVDYRPASITKGYSLLKFENMHSFIYSTVFLPFFLKRKLKFHRFRNTHFKLLNVEDIHNLKYLVCGSDQIWNPAITGGSLDPHYFGKIDGFKGKALAYAASDGGKLEKYDPEIVHDYITYLNAIAVREKSMEPFLRNYNDTVSSVLDPVFLPDIEFWQKLAGPQKYKNYILVYQMENNEKLMDDAYRLATLKSMKVIEICYYFSIKKWKKYNKHTICLSVGLTDFLSYFLYADYIFTNSFHGTAFSVIFKKKLQSYAISDDEKSKRIEYLLSDLNLARYYTAYSSNNNMDTLDRVDYSAADVLIEKKKKEAVDFLKNAILEDYQ